MAVTLAGMLANAKGGPIDYEGRSVMMGYRLPVTKGQEVFIEILKSNNTDEQGFIVSVDKNKGSIEIEGEKLEYPVFWTETAPKALSFKCYPKKGTGELLIWNVWRFDKHTDRIDAWIGNAGLYVEEHKDGGFILHCSNGMNRVDFEDLVLSVKVK